MCKQGLQLARRQIHYQFPRPQLAYLKESEYERYTACTCACKRLRINTFMKNSLLIGLGINNVICLPFLMLPTGARAQKSWYPKKFHFIFPYLSTIYFLPYECISFFIIGMFLFLFQVRLDECGKMDKICTRQKSEFAPTLRMRRRDVRHRACPTILRRGRGSSSKVMTRIDMFPNFAFCQN